MTISLESVGERMRCLADHEAQWIDGRIRSVVRMLSEREQFPDMIFDGQPYDEQTAHLRILQFYRDSMERGFSDIGRQILLDIAIEYGIETDLRDDVIQANWLKATQGEH